MPTFSGYYIKCQGAAETVAIILGKAEESSFVQIITDEQSFVTNFDKSACKITNHKFEISVDQNHAYEQGMTLNTNNDNLTVSGEVKFGPFTKLAGEQKKWRKFPGESIMGPFQKLPFMECRHMIVSTRHHLSGQITINGKIYNFDNGTGYIKGDRGKSFPKKYFWTQAHFDNIDISASCAIIPYLGLRFKGTICVVRFNDREHRLATYRGARIKSFTNNLLIIKQRKYKLIIEVLDNKTTHPLMAPARGKMSRTIHESVRHKVRYKFTRGKQVLFDETTERAAYEFSSLSSRA